MRMHWRRRCAKANSVGEEGLGEECNGFAKYFAVKKTWSRKARPLPWHNLIEQILLREDGEQHAAGFGPIYVMTRAGVGMMKIAGPNDVLCADVQIAGDHKNVFRMLVRMTRVTRAGIQLSEHDGVAAIRVERQQLHKCSRYWERQPTRTA